MQSHSHHCAFYTFELCSNHDIKRNGFLQIYLLLLTFLYLCRIAKLLYFFTEIIWHLSKQQMHNQDSHTNHLYVFELPFLYQSRPLHLLHCISLRWGKLWELIFLYMLHGLIQCIFLLYFNPFLFLYIISK